MAPVNLVGHTRGDTRSLAERAYNLVPIFGTQVLQPFGAVLGVRHPLVLVCPRSTTCRTGVVGTWQVSRFVDRDESCYKRYR